MVRYSFIVTKEVALARNQTVILHVWMTLLKSHPRHPAGPEASKCKEEKRSLAMGMLGRFIVFAWKEGKLLDMEWSW
jgi:hypothetical protein